VGEVKGGAGVGRNGREMGGAALSLCMHKNGEKLKLYIYMLVCV
jgi:hypothetical protein